MGTRIREFDWSDSPLGPPHTWPHGLRTAIRIMLLSRQPVWVGWGPDLIYFYNDAYKSIIGGKHPWALGKPTHVVWSEIWDVIRPMLATAMHGDEGTYVESQLLIMERNGYPKRRTTRSPIALSPTIRAALAGSSAPIAPIPRASLANANWPCSEIWRREPRSPKASTMRAKRARYRSQPIYGIFPSRPSISPTKSRKPFCSAP